MRAPGRGEGGPAEEVEGRARARRRPHLPELRHRAPLRSCLSTGATITLATRLVIISRAGGRPVLTAGRRDLLAWVARLSKVPRVGEPEVWPVVGGRCTENSFRKHQLISGHYRCSHVGWRYETPQRGRRSQDGERYAEHQQ